MPGKLKIFVGSNTHRKPWIPNSVPGSTGEENPVSARAINLPGASEKFHRFPRNTAVMRRVSIVILISMVIEIPVQ